jgi:hypothetical protein
MQLLYQYLFDREKLKEARVGTKCLVALRQIAGWTLELPLHEEPTLLLVSRQDHHYYQ